MQSKNLRDALQNDEPLTPEIQAEILSLVSYRCQPATVENLRRRIALPVSLWPCYGIFSRVHFDAHGVNYCAGQSYPDEIRELRRLILKG